MLQYKRSYTLSIQPPNEDVIFITGNRINFEISKSLDGIPNKAHIQIHNLSGNTLSYIQKKRSRITLSAGYEGAEKVIFKADIRNVYQVKTGVETIVHIFAGNAQRSWENAFINKTFSENVSIAQIVRDVVASFGEQISSDNLEAVPALTDKIRGLSLSGNSHKILDQLGEEYGFEWSIQDEELIVTEAEPQLVVEDAFLINSVTGMIDSPVITEIGVDVTTLLNPSYLPHGVFKVESVFGDLQLANLFFREVNRERTRGEGFYQIREVTHSGDTYGDKWYSSLRGFRFNA